MKKTVKNILAAALTITTLLVICVVPALAGEDHSYLDLRISGTGYDYSWTQYSDFYTPEWLVTLDPDYDRPQCVLDASLKNYATDGPRGFMKIYEGTSNHAGSSGVEPGYQYRIKGLRENSWDGYVTVQGHWDLNWNWQYDY